MLAWFVRCSKKKVMSRSARRVCVTGPALNGRKRQYPELNPPTERVAVGDQPEANRKFPKWFVGRNCKACDR
jgi:hypothetical protein